MVAASAVEGVVGYLLAIAGGVAAFLAFLLLRQVDRYQNDSDVSFDTDVANTVLDFERMMVGSIILFAGFLLYALSGMLLRPWLAVFARLFELVFVVILVTILYRWWVRFQ